MAEHGALTAAIEATGHVPITRRAAIRNSRIVRTGLSSDLC